jgi:calcineurin-like phosphoesterase family protein
MTTWFTADLHLGHRNIISYCKRPFADTDEMDRALLDGWNERVSPDDEVWVLGDFALGKLAATLPLVAGLHGRKVLVAGNHDRCWHGHGRRAEVWTRRYLDAGFDEIVQGETTMPLGGVAATLCHFPYRGDSHDQDRYVEHRPADRGGWLLHGHVHERWAQRDRMINVGVDVTGFRPISGPDIIDLIEAGPFPPAADQLTRGGG